MRSILLEALKNLILLFTRVNGFVLPVFFIWPILYKTGESSNKPDPDDKSATDGLTHEETTTENITLPGETWNSDPNKRPRYFVSFSPFNFFNIVYQ